MAHEVIHTRAQPEQWSELVGTAEEILGGETTMQFYRFQTAAMFKKVHRWPYDDIDANRYYGLGLAMCEFAREIQEPAIRGQLVDEGAQDLIRIKKPSEPQTIQQLIRKPPEDDVSFNLYKTLVRRGVERMPLAQVFVTDALSRYVLVQKLALNPFAMVGGMLQIPDVLRGDHIISALARNVHQGVFATLQEFEQAWSVAALSSANPSSELGAGRLRSQDVVVLAHFLARLRQDEFREFNAESGLSDDNPDSIRIVSDILATAPEPPEFNSIFDPLHESRLQCPALNVRGLIPAVVGLTVDMVERAEDMLKNAPN